MDFAAKKLSLIHWLSELNDLSVLNRIESIQSEIMNFKNIHPMSIDELLQRHLKSEADIKNNALISQDKLVAYFENK